MMIYFDMDGTIADLYGVENWLEYLINGDATPYRIAKPLVNLSLLARRIHQLQEMGFKVGIISWLSKNSTNEYDELVKQAKLEWLSKHLASVEWNEIHIVSYGTPKSTCATDKGILFDDEEKNLNEWGELAVNANKMLETLQMIKNGNALL